MTKLKPGKQLHELQKEVLEILYKFRVATKELIVQYQELESGKYTYTRLKILEEKGYIGRHYDGQYKIHGKHAIYYLLPKGIQALKTDTDLNLKALNGMYKDGSVSEQFMERCLGIFRLFIRFNEIYGTGLSFYTKSELTGNEHFPKPLPDAYLTLKPKQGTNQFMLDIFEATTPFYMVRRRILRYIDHFESGDWDVTRTDYPTLLLTCESPLLEKRTQRLVARLLDNADIDEIHIYTTTTKAFINANKNNKSIWSNVSEPEDLLSLEDL